MLIHGAIHFIFPYFLGSPFNLKYSLNLIQKDSSYTSNENSIDLELNLNKVKVGIGFQKRTDSAQKRIQIQAQLDLMDKLDEQLVQVVVMQRQIPPLAQKMLDTLETFIKLDTPFRIEERRGLFFLLF